MNNATLISYLKASTKHQLLYEPWSSSGIYIKGLEGTLNIAVHQGESI